MGRKTSEAQKEAARIRSRAYYQSHRDERKKYAKAYREANPKEVKERCKSWRDTHKSESAEYMKSWRQDHAAEVSAYNRTYNLENREEIKSARLRYRQTHKHKITTYNQSISGKYSAYKLCARQRGIVFALTKEEFALFWQQPCFYCGSSIETIGLDRYDNDKGYENGNVVPCCVRDNTIKHETHGDDYLRQIEEARLEIETNAALTGRI